MTYSYPDVVGAIYEKRANGSRGDLWNVDGKGVERRFFGIGNEDPSADGADPHVVFVVADNGIDFVAWNAVERFGGFIIDETLRMVVFQDA